MPVNAVFTMLRQGWVMAISPASGALSQTQLAVLEQIRALRAAKPVQLAAPVQASAPVRAAAPSQAKPLAAQPVVTAAADVPPANSRRGSILNIVA